MSHIICAESKDRIPSEDGVVFATRGDVDFFHPINRKLVEKIPEDQRKKVPISPEERGIDIHRAQAWPNGDYIAAKGLRMDRFEFSIPAEIAMIYLPKYFKEWHPEKRKKRRHGKAA